MAFASLGMMNDRNYWQRVLPPWPVVPARLWLTGAGAGLAVLNLIFERELWPGHPQAGRWGWATLALLLLAGGGQALVVLWRWPAAYAGPRWVRLVLRGLVWPACLGIAILLLGLLLGLSYLLAVAPSGLMPGQD